DLRQALEGNLCRCTGYVSIKNAAEYLREARLTERLAGKIRPAFLDEVESKLSACSVRSVSVEKDGKSFHAPRTFDELNALLKRIPHYRLLNGGTDVVVAMKKHHVPMQHLIDLSRLEGMKEIAIEPEQIRIGGGATLARIKEATEEVLPALAAALGQMASHQVRTLATLAGNLGNASPIADTAPLLLAADATLVLQGETTREVPLSAFYEGYKQTNLQPGEWIREIKIPRKGFLHFEKVSKRRAVDIATVNGAIGLSLDGKKVKDARVAFGGVAATPVLAPRAAQALIGKELSVETAQEAARVALEDLAPLTDVRGSKEYRRALIEGILTKHVLAALSWEG
ncbi:MAG: FAD binding domain-containing protein, partial [Bacteroidota bacterium]